MKAIVIILAVCIASLSTLSACDGTAFLRTPLTGSGKLITEKRALQDFKGVEAGGAIEVVITAQQDFSVEVEADDNVIGHIETNVSDGVLRISTDPTYSYSNTTVRVRVSLPQLTDLDISGASNAKVTGVNSEHLIVGVSGASTVTAEGTSKQLHGEVSGASSLKAEKLSAERVTIEVSGASKGYVHATGSIAAEASGASTIYYSGEPKNREEETSGASSIKRR